MVKSTRWLMVSCPALLIGMLLAPQPGAGQSRLQVGISPLTSSGGADGIVREIGTVAGDRAVYMATGRTFGLAVDAGLEGLPLRLRLGTSYSTGGLRYAMSGRHVADEENVAGAKVRTTWVDFVVEPFSWKVSPYGLVGLTRRTTSYEGLSLEASPYFGDTEKETMYRYGLGVDFQLSDRTSLWTEAARNYTVPGLLGGNGFRPLEDPSLLFGFRLSLF